MRLIYYTAIGVNIALTLTMVFSAAAQKTYPGFRQWILGTAMVATTYAGIAFRGTVPDGLAIVVTNLALPLSAVCYYDGMRRFLGMTPLPRAWYGLPAAVAIAGGVSYLIHDDMGLRSFLQSTAFAVPHWATAWLVVAQLKKERFIFYRVVAVEMGIAATLVFASGARALVTTGYSVFDASPTQVAYIVTLIALQCIAAIAFIVLNNERLQTDLAEAESALAVRLRDLQKAMLEVKTLRGLLPICASCKRIRDSQGDWTEFEVYVRDRTEASFSHGVCPDCAGRLYPDFV